MRTGFTLVVLVAFGTVVAAGTLFACPLMQAPSCCSKSQPERHCPAEFPEKCVLAFSENKIVPAKLKATAAIAPVAVAIPAPGLELADEPVPPVSGAQRGRDIYLLNRVLLI